MKKLFLIIILFFLTSCSTGKQTYWCGDHPCVNNEEKEEYFKKTMIVETKDIEKKSSKNNSEIEKVILQAQNKDKKKIKENKNLDKQAKLEAKRIKKEKKMLEKQAKLEAKRIEKEDRELNKKSKTDTLKTIKEEKTEEEMTNTNSDVRVENRVVSSTSFNELVEIITNRNILRPYPDINDIQD